MPTLTVWNAANQPVLVLSGARAARAVASLPAEAGAALRATGYYETSRPAIARSHWRILFDLFDDEPHGRKLDGPVTEIENTSWGKIKETFT